MERSTISFDGLPNLKMVDLDPWPHGSHQSETPSDPRYVAPRAPQYEKTTPKNGKDQENYTQIVVNHCSILLKVTVICTL